MSNAWIDPPTWAGSVYTGDKLTEQLITNMENVPHKLYVWTEDYETPENGDAGTFYSLVHTRTIAANVAWQFVWTLVMDFGSNDEWQPQLWVPSGVILNGQMHYIDGSSAYRSDYYTVNSVFGKSRWNLWTNNVRGAGSAQQVFFIDIIVPANASQFDLEFKIYTSNGASLTVKRGSSLIGNVVG